MTVYDLSFSCWRYSLAELSYLQAIGDRKMPRREYIEESRAKWLEAIRQIAGPVPPHTSIWRDLDSIMSALLPFAGANNHLFFPQGGGYDICGVRPGTEPDTIEFVVQNGIASLVKPRSLTLEYVATQPAESFLIVELEPLELSGIYGADPDVPRRRQEELVELAAGDYAERWTWDAGYVEHDGDGREVPLPADARVLKRILDGRMMLVNKIGVWSSVGAHYDGRHDRLTNQQIRDLIEQAVSGGSGSVTKVDGRSQSL